ncbi:MAG: hypothetical protein U1F76_15130 [Candidatus Competibacteraceae bacterium]
MLKELDQPIEADTGTVLDQIERVVRWSDEFRLAFTKCNRIGASLRRRWISTSSP